MLCIVDGRVGRALASNVPHGSHRGARQPFLAAVAWGGMAGYRVIYTEKSQLNNDQFDVSCRQNSEAIMMFFSLSQIINDLLGYP